MPNRVRPGLYPEPLALWSAGAPTLLWLLPAGSSQVRHPARRPPPVANLNARPDPGAASRYIVAQPRRPSQTATRLQSSLRRRAAHLGYPTGRSFLSSCPPSQGGPRGVLPHLRRSLPSLAIDDWRLPTPSPFRLYPFHTGAPRGTPSPSRPSPQHSSLASQHSARGQLLAFG